ncbi:unnamed protein product [Toxocara canis]|uniref:LRRNT domain-containing protein n=1 Tax=Toxocara canis TaxID=6265 RepID=A0A183V446_TOXCA|nr:unnamed protein product [Toxocara canis]
MCPQRYVQIALSSLALAMYAYGMCPTGCECTSDERHTVTCDGALLQEIPSLLDPRTRRLSLAHCNIRTLDADVLELYADLEYLDLSGNDLEDIGRGFFRYQTRLKVLKLKRNKISTIQRDAFVGLSALQVRISS